MRPRKSEASKSLLEDKAYLRDCERSEELLDRKKRAHRMQKLKARRIMAEYERLKGNKPLGNATKPRRRRAL